MLKLAKVKQPNSARSQKFILGEQAEHRAEKLRVVKMVLLLHFWQAAPQGKGHHDHQDAGDPVDRAPAAKTCQQPGNGSRQQNPQQQAAHDRSHHFAALFRRCERGG